MEAMFIIANLAINLLIIFWFTERDIRAVRAYAVSMAGFSTIICRIIGESCTF